MLEGIVLGVFTVFVFLGVISVAYYIALKILYPKGAGRYIVIIPADCETKDVAGMLYAEKLRMGIMGDKGCVIALDRGMEEGELLLCANMCKESSGIYVCPPEQLSELILREDL